MPSVSLWRDCYMQAVSANVATAARTPFFFVGYNSFASSKSFHYCAPLSLGQSGVMSELIVAIAMLFMPSYTIVWPCIETRKPLHFHSYA